MLSDYLQISKLSLIFVGDFNPVIIQPFWLASKKLIREQEAQSAVVEVIHPEIVKFSLDWLKVEVTKDRFELTTTQEPFFEPVRDLAISIFEILAETPLTGIGINHLRYFALTDKERYYEFGNKLAPLSIWESVLKEPRLMALEIFEPKRENGIPGNFRVRIQPSDIKLSTNFGILININDHYQITPGNNGRDGEIIKLLGENWSYSVDKASSVIETIWSKVNS